MKRIVFLAQILCCCNLITAQNVGIDVASPVEKLDVLGAIRIGTTSNTNAGTIRWNSPNFQGYDGTQWVNFGGGTVTGSGTATRVAFWSGTSALSSSANLYWDNTNNRLGIGSSSPSSILDAVNNSTAGYPTGDAKIRVKSNSTQSYGRFWAENDLGTFQMSGIAGSASLFSTHWNNAGFLYVSSAAPGYFYHVNKSTGFHAFEIGQNNDNAENRTEIMRINSTGVGIGTNNPGAMLEVAGQVKITGGTPGANKVLTSDAAGLASWVDPTTMGIDATTASNGLTETGNDIRLGGSLTGNTTVAQAANTLAFTSTAANGFSVDGATFSVDAAANRVGIGTSSPSSKLEVEVSGGAEGLHVTGTATQSGLNPLASFWGDLGSSPDQFSKSVNIVNNGSSGNLVRLQFTDAAPGMALSQLESAYNGGLPYLSFRTSTGVGNISEKMRITAAGNVGIGSTVPGAKLEVAGQVKITGGTPALNQVLTSDAAGLATWEPAQGDNLGNHIATQNLQLNSNWLSNDGGSEGIRVDNNGNVGVGQTPGSAYLDITGTNSGTTSLQLRSGNSNIGTASNQVTFGYNGTENYRHAIKTRHNSGGVADNAIDFYTWKQGTDATTTVGTQHVMTVSAANSGSVGIGTTTPGAQLHTTGSVRLAGLTGDVQTSAVMSDGSGNLSTRALNAVAFTGDLASGDGDYIQNQSVGANFATGQNASFDIQSNAEIGGTLAVNNNIGIGTTTPGNPLEIVKAGGNSAMFRNTSSTDYSGIRFYNDQNINVRALEIDYSGSAYPIALMNSGVIGESGSIATTGAYPLQIGTNNTLRIMVKGDGNVGIGTSLPTATLEVNGSTWIRSIPVLGRGATSYNSLGYETRISAAGTTPPLVIDQAGTPSFIFNANGNLGIGGVTPATRLDLGTSTSGNKPLIHFNPGTATGVSYPGYAHHDFLMGSYESGGYSQHYISFGYGGDPNRKFHIGSASDANFDGSTTFVPGLTVNSGGNVGIGQPSPSAKLDVVGTVEMFGAWTSKASGTVYQADRDGFVIAWAGGSYFRILTDGSNPPTTTRMETEGNTGNASRPNIMCPVRKGDYWKIEVGGGNTPTVWWMPLGQ